jgi:glycine cleavage system transcriptional repressor
MDKNYFAITFVAEDRPGIVADVTKILYDNGFNIDDSSSTLLRGIFAMILVVSTKDQWKNEDIKNLFFRLNYMTTSVKKIDKSSPALEGENYSISVYGADKAGIVYNVSKFLADKKINIVDLQTKVAGKEGKPIYIMLMEVVAPFSVSSEWVKELKTLSKEIGVDIAIKSIETFEL